MSSAASASYISNDSPLAFSTLSGLANNTISSTVSALAKVNATFLPITPVDPIILTFTIVIIL